jgi:hypothetical protein
VNGYIRTAFTFNGRRLVFDGTTRGLATAAHREGCRPGDTVTVTEWSATFVMVATGGGDRTPDGTWMDRAPESAP